MAATVLAFHRRAEGPLTLGDFLTRWLRHKRSQVRPNTLDNYADVLERYVTPWLGQTPLSELRPLMFLDLFERLEASGVTRSRIHNARRVLHAALNDACRWELVTRNAATHAKAPKQKKRRRRVWSAAQTRVFLSYLREREPLKWSFFVLATTIGVRRSELCAARWEDLDLERRELQIRRSFVRVGNRYQIGEPKSDAAERTVVLPSLAVEALERTPKISAWIWPSSKGDRPIVGNILGRWFKDLTKRWGLPDVRFHDLRHAVATLSIAAGVDVKTVQKQLGHATAQVTLDIYTHASSEAQHAAAKTLDGVFAEPEKDGEG